MKYQARNYGSQREPDARVEIMAGNKFSKLIKVIHAKR